MNEELAALGNAIRRIRKTRNISQMALGELCGLHRSYICDIERGTRNVTFLSLVKLARALSMNASEIVRDAEAASPQCLFDQDTPDSRSEKQKRHGGGQLSG
jgi:transcriptional regulator with XRE-family HTH domain